MDRASVRAWIQASRPPFFVATFVPLAIGWILAGQRGAWHPLSFFAVALGSFLVHLATNLANDYFDHVQGTDDGRAIGGSRVIQQGKLSPRAILVSLYVLYGAAGAIGLLLMSLRGLWDLLPLTLVALFSSIFYVAPPIRYGYHGLGELAVGINMGPVMLCGTEWAVAGSPSWRGLLVSVPVGFMVAAILYFQSLPDLETDRAAGKITLALRLGRRGAYLGLILFWVAAWGSVVALVAGKVVGPVALLCLALTPLLVRLLGIVRRTVDWIELDQYGWYVRLLYLLTGLALIAGLKR